MTVITYNTTPTLVESDGSDTDWKGVPMTGYHVFPYNTAFIVNDVTWAIEFYVRPGRYRDLLNCSLLKQTDDGYLAIYDWAIKTGIEVVIDDTIRILGVSVIADLRDNYETKKVHGSYSVAIAEVV